MAINFTQNNSDVTSQKLVHGRLEQIKVFYPFVTINILLLCSLLTRETPLNMITK